MSSFDLVEAFQVSHAVATLHDLKVLASLAQPSGIEALAARHRLDAVMLRGILEYVAARTDLVRKTGKVFVATRCYSSASRFLLDLYAGAYGRNATQLANLLRQPSLASGTVDRVRHARAFESVGGNALDGLSNIIRQLGLNHVLDLGCGPATLLLQLATQDSKFVGWGLEMNPAMGKAARAGIRAARVGGRIKLIEGDSTRLRAALPAEIRGKVRAVTASQVANELFGDGTSRAVAWLRGMRRILPHRPLLLADYYGRLGSKVRTPRRETLLHDYAQLISGQGVPPANLDAWRAIYAEAGCRLAHVLEDKSTTLFIHIVML